MFDRLIDVALSCIKVIPRFKTIPPDEAGVVTRFGRYVKTLDEGGHFRFHWPIMHEITTILVTRQLIDVPTQSITTSDKKSVHLDTSIEYTIENPRKAVFNCEDHDKQLQEKAGDAFRKVISSYTMEYCLENMHDICDRVYEMIDEIADREYGVAIVDILVPSFTQSKTLRLIQ